MLADIHAIREDDPAYEVVELLPLLGEDRLILELERDIDYLTTKVGKFSDLTRILRSLADYQNDVSVSHKARQDSAVVLFTMVTIVFTPLNWVAGMLSMNTLDVRDMTHKQWIYWVVAIPLTASIIAATVWKTELWKADPTSSTADIPGGEWKFTLPLYDSTPNDSWISRTPVRKEEAEIALDPF